MEKLPVEKPFFREDFPVFPLKSIPNPDMVLRLPPGGNGGSPRWKNTVICRFRNAEKREHQNQ